MANIYKSDKAGIENAAWMVLFIFLCGFILYWGKTVFIPISYAILISFILLPLCQWLEKKHLPRPLAITISLLGLLALITAIVILLAGQLGQFATEWPALKSKVLTTWTDMQSFVYSRTSYTVEEQNKWINETLSGTTGGLLSFIKSFVYGSVVNAVLLILIPILSALLLYSREKWLRVLILIFKDTKPEEVKQLLKETVHAYSNFIKGMGIVYFSVGMLNSIGLLALGIPHPFLFGFIASILTFIPYVGIMVASLLPITISWMEFDSAWYPLGVIAVFTVVQYLEANVIFPLAVSSRLDINPFMTIVVILLGGLMWGASGMILFVPFAAILKLIADRSEKLKTIRELLGSN